jgi:hypothetical protein
MVITFRVSKRLEQGLERAARAAGLSRSEFVRRCLVERLAEQAKGASLYEAGKHLFGLHASGRTDLSTNAEKIVKEKILAKARRAGHRTDRGAVRPTRPSS